jgi:steroid delta-isomerase-like uncharacterized protein
MNCSLPITKITMLPRRPPRAASKAARRFIETFRAAIPDLHVMVEDQYAEGSTVTTRWTASGTHEGPLIGVPASHRRVEVSGISIDRFDEEGRLVEGWRNWDGIALLRQVGALPTMSP